jgi:hypothetical protein
MSYHLIRARTARKEHKCSGCDDPIEPGWKYTQESYSMTFESGKRFTRLKTWHHFCFFNAYMKETPKQAYKEARRYDKDRRKKLNRRNYLIRQLLKPLEMDYARTLARELAAVSAELELDMTQVRNITYDRELLAAKVENLLAS